MVYLEVLVFISALASWFWAGVEFFSWVFSRPMSFVYSGFHDECRRNCFRWTLTAIVLTALYLLLNWIAHG